MRHGKTANDPHDDLYPNIPDVYTLMYGNSFILTYGMCHVVKLMNLTGKEPRDDDP